MKEFPNKTSFSCIIKPLVSEEKDKYLALASLEQIKSFLPNIDIKSNEDLLPIAFNAAVVGRVNKNDDVIDKEIALAIYKNFLYKQINIEHKRSNVVGVILTAGFSEFGTDKPLSEEDIKDKKEPFNITLGGVLWRVVNNELTEFVEDSNDPTSENYMDISASWELGFSEYKLITLPEGQKNITNGEIYASEEDVQKYKDNLRALGGDGKLGDKRLYRMPYKDVTPLGIGLTEKPAADVKGILTNEQESKANMNINIEKELEEINKLLKVSVTKESMDAAFKAFSENNTSQAKKTNVNQDIINKTYTHMPIKNIKDITDETLKEATAATISDVISNHIAEKSKEWEAEQTKLTTELSKASDEQKKLSEDNLKLQETLKQLQAKVEAFEKESKERNELEKFNVRMASTAEVFEFDTEARLAIVEEIKALASDEAFDKWLARAKILYKGFAKQNKEKESNATVLENAIENGDKDKNKLTNTTSTNPPTMLDKAKIAFAKEGFEIKFGRK